MADRVFGMFAYTRPPIKRGSFWVDAPRENFTAFCRTQLQPEEIVVRKGFMPGMPMPQRQDDPHE